MSIARGIKLPNSPSEWGFKGENYLLTIGIDKYLHWKPLNNAVKDVRDITRLLTERYQFETGHLQTLVDDEATEDNIRKKLLDVKKSITTDDNLVVFFSGHGHYDSDLDEGYWVPANARKDNPSDYISNSDVLKWIRAIKTHHTLIIVDSCFSGTLVSQSRSEVLSEKYPSARIFASGRKELVDDGVPGTNSPFAKAILSRLSHNTDRVLRASELIQNVTKSVESQAGQAPIEGRIKDAGDEGGEFVFHLKVTEEEIWASVLNANTSDEYAKYIDYFPDGQYVLEARTKLSSLTDETDWKRAVETSTTTAMAAYLESHPRGEHYEEAFRKLEELEENDSWLNTKTRNSVSAYMDYLRKYPAGRFTSVARKNLEELKGALRQDEQDIVKDELADLEDKSTKVSDNKTRYKGLLNEAEGLYAQMSYQACIAKYQAALKLYENHFVPDRKFIEQRIKEAERHVSFLELVEDGKKAVTDGNYELALQFFRKARTIDDTMKIREWITHAEKKLKGDFQFTPITQKAKPVQPVNTKKGGWSWIVWTILFAVVGVIGLVIYSISSSVHDMNNAYNVMNDDQNLKENKESNYQAPASWADYVPGTWQTPIIGGYATWYFYGDGSLTYLENGISYNGNWSLQDQGETFNSTITVPDLKINGYISFISTESMTLLLNTMLGEYTYVLSRT